MRRADILAQARDEGAMEAARQLRRLGVDQSRAVDIFKIILDADLWLLFQPLGELLGAYVADGSGGILINTRRSLGMQRLTAAHEYGHHVLRHAASADSDEQVQNPETARQADEAAAQAFAMDLLMPPRLVNTLWRELNVPQLVEPYHAYLLSLYMGTSYQATVYQLVALRKISAAHARGLLRVSPKQVKQAVGRGLGPRNPWAEVWPVNLSNEGQEMVIGVEDEVRLCLPESPTTGYRWELEMDALIDLRASQAPSTTEGGVAGPTEGTTEPGPSQVLGLLQDEFEPQDRTLFTEGTGGAGNRYLRIVALRRGACELRLSLRRAWDRRSEPAEQFRLSLRLLGKPTGDTEQGYFDEAKEAHLALAA